MGLMLFFEGSFVGLMPTTNDEKEQCKRPACAALC